MAPEQEEERADTGAPDALRRLRSPDAAALAALSDRAEELRTVLRCCERLVGALAEDEPDDLLVDGLWTLALLAYSRAFAPGEADVALAEADVAQAGDGAPAWHRGLLRLREVVTDPVRNPREDLSVAAAQGADGTAVGVAVVSAPRPRVDDLTVRQTGAIAYTLSGVLDARIESRQDALRASLAGLARADLDRLEKLDVTG